jgi:demethylspheroidene O-methyltransferase
MLVFQSGLRLNPPVDMTWFESLQERIARSRNRLLSSPRFQRWAGGFALTRPLARRNASAVFDIVAGFVYSQILLACVRLNLFEILNERPHTLAALSIKLGLSQPAAKRLLDAAISLQLVESRAATGANGEGREIRYGLGVLGAPLVGNQAVLAMVEHHAMVYADLRDPVALLRGEQSTGLANYWPYAANEVEADVTEARVAAYTKLMAASQPLVADEILDAYPLERHQCLLDVGGGDGTFLCKVAERHAGLQLRLFDLPAVASLAEKNFAGHALGARATAFGGNFLTDPLPTGADIISFVRIIHDHDDERVHTILTAARKALPPGGRVLIAEPMSGTPGAARIGDAYFGFYLLAMGRGRARTPTEMGELLEASGFHAPRLIPTRIPMQTSLMVATVND